MVPMVINMKLRPARWPFSLEKWYIGALLSDGSVLHISLGGLRIMGVPLARVEAELHRPGLPLVRGTTPARFLAGGGSVLQCGSARIDHDKLHFETPGLSGQLSFKPRFAPTQLQDALLQDGERKLEWLVEIPDADVSGRITWPGGSLNVDGRGYRDRFYYDMLPWRTHCKDLKWGRALTQSHSAIWMEGITPMTRTRAMWRNGERCEDNPPVVQNESMRVLSKDDVVNLHGSQLGVMRPLLSRLSGHPVEVKQTGVASLGGERGVAILSSVHWKEVLPPPLSPPRKIY